jgi:hypothetical protein
MKCNCKTCHQANYDTYTYPPSFYEEPYIPILTPKTGVKTEDITECAHYPLPCHLTCCNPPKQGVSGDQNAGIKHDEGKLRMDLVPISAIEAMAEILGFGSSKYGDRNWEKGLAYSRVYAALLRHLTAWFDKQGLDEESGKSHLKHAMCCLAFLVEFERKQTGEDDRP